MAEPNTNSHIDSQTTRQTISQRRQEADALRLAITRTARRLRQEAGSGLSPTVLATLASIERHKVVTPGELAQIENVRRPTMTRAISRLADADLIERREDPEDRRSSLISVSQKGHEYLAAHRSRKSAWLANLIEQMPEDDAATLARAAEILSGALEGHRTGEYQVSPGGELQASPGGEHQESQGSLDGEPQASPGEGGS